jgi:hypothetical protein
MATPRSWAAPSTTRMWVPRGCLFATKGGGVWSQQGNKLQGLGRIGAAMQGHGVALSADGNTALLGGYYDNNYQGAAWVFIRDAGSGMWSQQGNKLIGTGSANTSPQLGYSVALSGDGNTALVGAIAHSYGFATATGASWVFVRNATGAWAQQGSRLLGTGGAGSYSLQGWSVALSADGNTAFVGGPWDNVNRGGSWIFVRDTSSGVWTQKGNKMVGTWVGAASYQGVSIALSGDGRQALVGGTRDSYSRGSVWAFSCGA